MGMDDKLMLVTIYFYDECCQLFQFNIAKLPI